MSILVTGSSGFIGRNLVAYLHSRKLNIVGIDKVFPDHTPHLDRPDLVYAADITNEQAISSVQKNLLANIITGPDNSKTPGKIDACIHLAAVAAPRLAASDPMTAWDTNVRGTYNVLNLCRNLGIHKFVFASSAHVYGISPRYLPTNESHPLAMHDTYTTTKIVGESLCDLFHSNYRLSTTVLRLFNAYGPGQSDDYFMGVKIKQAREGGPITLMNSSVTKDWVYIDDVVKAFFMASQSEYVGALNIGTGAETDLGTIARQIGHFYDLQVTEEPGSDNSPSRMACDNYLAKSVLGWKPEIDLRTGLHKTMIAGNQGIK